MNDERFVPAYAIPRTYVLYSQPDYFGRVTIIGYFTVTNLVPCA